MVLLVLACSASWHTVGGDTGPKGADTADTTADSGDSDSAGADDTADTSHETAESGETGETAESGETGETAETGETGESGDTAGEIPAPCATYAEPVQIGTVADKSLNEISGIAVSRVNPDVLWVHEDHSGAASVYALDTAGNVLMELALDGATNNDWEDLAVAPCGAESCIWVGEIGNNAYDRVGLGVYRIVEPLLTDLSSSPTTVPWEFFEFTYPEDAENAEALYIGLDGLPVLLSKRYNAGTSGVYQLPTLDPAAPVVVSHLGDVYTSVKGDKGAGAEVTGADLWPDGSRVIVRTYGHVYELDATGGAAGLATATRTEQVGSGQVHGEAIAYDPYRRGFWEVSEGINPGLWFTGCAAE